MTTLAKTQDIEESWVGFRVAEIGFALPITHVREIINSGILTEVPGAPLLIKGVIERRGEIVPVLDLRERFGLVPERLERKQKWILIQVQDRQIGLAVDQVTRVFRTPLSELRPAPDIRGAFTPKGIRGVLQHEGQLVFVLEVSDLERLIAPISMDYFTRVGGKGR